jgi:hypothetical protein
VERERERGDARTQHRRDHRCADPADRERRHRRGTHELGEPGVVIERLAEPLCGAFPVVVVVAALGAILAGAGTCCPGGLASGLTAIALGAVPRGRHRWAPPRRRRRHVRRARSRYGAAAAARHGGAGWTITVITPSGFPDAGLLAGT